MSAPHKLTREVRDIIKLCVCSLCPECKPEHQERCYQMFKEQAVEIIKHLRDNGHVKVKGV